MKKNKLITLVVTIVLVIMMMFGCSTQQDSSDSDEHISSYTITFDANGGEGSMADIDITYDVSVDLPVNTFTRDDYTFVRWCDKQYGIGKSFSDGAAVINLADANSNTITLYAIWKDDKNYVSTDGSNDIVINNVKYPNTSITQVIDTAVTVTGSDENWSSYIDSSDSSTDDDCKGVFIAGRNVRIDPYSMGKYPVTQQLFIAVMKYNPSIYNQNDYSLRETETDAKLRPVEFINWYAAITFCNKLSLMMGKEPCYSVKVAGSEVDWINLKYSDIPGGEDPPNETEWNAVAVNMSANGYRLPTEAEWEFAARGGDQSNAEWKYAFSGVQSLKPLVRITRDFDADYGGETYGVSQNLSTDSNFETVGWYDHNSGMTYQVGMKTPNRLGLYDMSGNVEEWCWDWYDSSKFPRRFRILRGGCGVTQAWKCSVSYRNCQKPNRPNIQFGFRLACSGD